MQTNFKKLFRVLFFLVSAIVFLFVFLPEKCFPKKNRLEETAGQSSRKRMLRKKVYYTRGDSDS